MDDNKKTIAFLLNLVDCRGWPSNPLRFHFDSFCLRFAPFWRLGAVGHLALSFGFHLLFVYAAISRLDGDHFSSFEK